MSSPYHRCLAGIDSFNSSLIALPMRQSVTVAMSVEDEVASALLLPMGAPVESGQAAPSDTQAASSDSAAPSSLDIVDLPAKVFDRQEQLDIMDVTLRKRAAPKPAAVPLLQQFINLKNAGLLTTKGRLAFEREVELREEVRLSAVRMGFSEEEAVRRAAEADKEFEEDLLDILAADLEPFQAEDQISMVTMEWRRGPPLKKMSRTDLLEIGVNRSTLIGVEALAPALSIHSGVNGYEFHSLDFHAMQDISLAMREQDTRKVCALIASHKAAVFEQTVDHTDSCNVDTKLLNAEKKLKITKRLHTSNGMGAHSIIVPLTLLEDDERAWTDGPVRPEDLRKTSITTSEHIDERLSWEQRRFDYQTLLLDNKILTGSPAGLVPRDERDGKPMLGDSGIDKAAANAVRDFLAMDKEFEVEWLLDKNGKETEEEDAFIWVRTEPANSKIPKLAIIRLSQFNGKKHKRGMRKTPLKSSGSKSSDSGSSPPRSDTKPSAKAMAKLLRKLEAGGGDGPRRSTRSACTRSNGEQQRTTNTQGDEQVAEEATLGAMQQQPTATIGEVESKPSTIRPKISVKRKPLQDEGCSSSRSTVGSSAASPVDDYQQGFVMTSGVSAGGEAQTPPVRAGARRSKRLRKA